MRSHSVDPGDGTRSARRTHRRLGPPLPLALTLRPPLPRRRAGLRNHSRRRQSAARPSDGGRQAGRFRSLLLPTNFGTGCNLVAQRVTAGGELPRTPVPRTPRSSSHERPFRILGIASTIEISETYEKPHGRRLGDGKVICWGQADDWKAVLMGLHERAYARRDFAPHAAVLFRAVGRYHAPVVRMMIEDAATRLGIERLLWLDD